MESKKYSFKGFKLSKNFLSALKNMLYTLVPAVIAELVTNNLITAGVAALVGPMVLKSIEYWMNEY